MRNTAVYFDCELLGSRVAYQGRELPAVEVPRGTAAGTVGLVAFDQAAGAWRFEAYRDPSLRRRPELDTSDALGWSNARQRAGWTAPRGLVPGVDGRWIEDATAPVQIDVPAEFFGLCRLFRSAPEDVLRGFIADACTIEDDPAEPRADGYNRTSAAGTVAAEDYLNLVLGPRVDFATLVVYRLPDDDFEEDDEQECPLMQIQTGK